MLDIITIWVDSSVTCQCKSLSLPLQLLYPHSTLLLCQWSTYCYSHSRGFEVLSRSLSLYCFFTGMAQCDFLCYGNFDFFFLFLLSEGCGFMVFTIVYQYYGLLSLRCAFTGPNIYWVIWLKLEHKINCSPWPCWRKYHLF